jgi:hypothetical protein
MSYEPRIVTHGLTDLLEKTSDVHEIQQAGTKYDEGKPDMSLLSSVAIEEVAKVMTFGKRKYAAHNWRKGISYSRCIAAALRHIFAYLRGEDIDPESGLSHLGHAICCLMFLLEFILTGRTDLDDRYKGNKNEQIHPTT